MATISITIPDDKLVRVRDGICGMYEYQENIEDPNDPEATIPNPETKAQFCKRMMAKWAKDNVKSWEANIAADAARDAAIAVAEAINIT